MFVPIDTHCLGVALANIIEQTKKDALETDADAARGGLGRHHERGRREKKFRIAAPSWWIYILARMLVQEARTAIIGTSSPRNRNILGMRAAVAAQDVPSTTVC